MAIALEHLPADALGLSPLARAVLADRPRPALLGGLPVPARLDQLDPATATADSPFLERRELAELLLAHRDAAGLGGLHPAQARSLERLAEPSSQVVVCGQRPGLVGGPLSNLFKALHAVRLARALEAAWGRPVVPLVLVQSDDHDVAEVGHVHVLNRHLDLARVGLSGMGSGRRAIADLRLDRDEQRLESVREGLRQLLPAGAERDPLLDAWFPRHGETLSTAFVRGWEHVLGHTGLLFLEPAAIRVPLSRALAQVVSVDLDAALRAGRARLAAAGIPPPADPERPAWVFRHGPDGRRALRPTDGTFRFDDGSGEWSAVELAALLVDRPREWSAGDLLRPLVQDLCLPVAAHLGGWGELEDHSLLAELRATAVAPLTPFCTRLGGTLVSSATDEALRRVGLDVAEALARRGCAVDPAPEDDMTHLVAMIRSINTQKTDELKALQTALGAVDRGLAQQLRRAVKQSADVVEQVARKAERVGANRRGKANRHYRRINNTLFGLERPQERILTTLQFGAAFGLDWIDPLLADIEPLPSEHLVIKLLSRDGLSE